MSVIPVLQHSTLTKNCWSAGPGLANPKHSNRFIGENGERKEICLEIKWKKKNEALIGFENKYLISQSS